MDNTNKNIWKAVLAEFELSLSKANYQTWLSDTMLLSIDQDVATIYVPNIFTRDWVAKKYQDQIIDLINKQTDQQIVSIELTTTAPSDFTPTKPATKSRATNNEARQPTTVEKPGSVASQKFPSRYNFQNFIVGSSNRLAFSAAQLVVEKPGEVYNPLFLYGPAGVGKTHLMSAIASEIAAKSADSRILYVTTEEFINSFVGAIRKGEKFTNKYREVDVLLVDDLQFIATAEKTKEEFFHTFNALYQKNKQIVLCSDRPPREIPTLEDRLRSRFEWGMVADIQPPDLETRIAILLNKAAVQAVDLPSEVAEYIASVVDQNIRELEGALIKVIAYSRAHNESLSVEIAEKVLDGVKAQKTRSASPNKVLEVCSQYYEVGLKDILGTKRDREIVVPRQVAMYVMRQELNISFPKIAQSLGGRDHTTIMHGVRKIQKLKSSDQQLAQDILQIKQELGVS